MSLDCKGIEAIAEKLVMDLDAEDRAMTNNCYPMAWKMFQKFIYDTEIDPSEYEIRYTELFREEQAKMYPAAAPHAVVLITEIEEGNAWIVDAANYDFSGIEVKTWNEYRQEQSVTVMEKFNMKEGFAGMVSAGMAWGPWSEKLIKYTQEYEKSWQEDIERRLEE